jgi:bifunctional non-homologous end joining protein LigD
MREDWKRCNQCTTRSSSGSPFFLLHTCGTFIGYFTSQLIPRAPPLAEYDVIKALPDSVVAQPRRLVEEREPRAARPARSAESEIDLSGAVRGPLPAKLEPQLTTLATSLPTSDDGVTEAKLNGYRLLARVDKGRVRLITRSGHDWTAKFPALKEIEELPFSTASLDGEITVLEDGLPSFAALRDAIDGRANREIVYFLFDLMSPDGRGFRKVPLWTRRAQLAGLLDEAGERLRFSLDFEAPPAQIFEAAAGLGLEG